MAMAQSGRNAFTDKNNKKTATNFDVSTRFETLEALINNVKKETHEKLKTVFWELQTSAAKSDQMRQQISQLQELIAKESKRISNQEQNRAKENDAAINSQSSLPSVRDPGSATIAPLPSSVLSEAARKPENSLANQLANTVDSVVGLKEAITWQYRWLKWIWAATLLVGIIATVWFVYSSTAEYLDEPTATKVKLVTQPNYDYPTIFLCSAGWLDTPKALSIGLSLDGLKYSLGYIDEKGDKPTPDNVTKAKQEFLDFFDEHNFTSFTDYLMTISVDIPVIQSAEAYASTLSTSALCVNCKNDTILSKTVFDGQMCYSFPMRPESNHRSTVERFIGIKLIDQTMGLLPNSVWTLHIDANTALRAPTAPQMAVNSFTVTSVRITSEQFSSLNTPESPCVAQENVNKGYSQRICIAECLVSLYNQNLNCTPYAVTVNATKYHPKQLCNPFAFKSMSPLSYWAVQDIIRTTTENVTSSKEAEKCYQKCPLRCQRTTYEASRQQDISFADYNPAASLVADQARLLNISMAGLFLEHSAVYQGGIMTWTEISTISFTSMVSNIGGALGLFVGGTVMTFVQLILFFVRYLLERYNKRTGDDVFVRTSQI